MGFFKTYHTIPVPDECKGMDVKIQSSTCTGEKTIGFYDRTNKKLMYQELVLTATDIDAFYEKYGLKKIGKK